MVRKKEIIINVPKGEGKAPFILDEDDINLLKTSSHGYTEEELEAILSDDQAFAKLVELYRGVLEAQRTNIDELNKKLAEKKARRKQQKPQTIKRPRHLVNQRLKYYYPEDKKNQMEIFNSLSERVKESILQSAGEGLSLGVMDEGIRLSPGEEKAIDAISTLLAQKSKDISNPLSEDFYIGNAGIGSVVLGVDAISREEVKAKAPRLEFTPYEWAIALGGGSISGGKDIDDALKVLRGLAQKVSLRTYKVVIPEGDGSRREIEAETYAPLMKFIKFKEAKYTNGDIETSKRETIIIELDPLFRLQIDNYFVEHKADLIERTCQAYGSAKVSGATYRLRDYLLREKSEKRFNPDIYLDRLNWMLCEGYMKSRNAHKVKHEVDKAIQAMKNLELLLDYEVVPGATGELKAVFHINKKWK